MKKLIFTLLALVGTMSMNAQIVKIMKGNTVVGIYNAAEADNVVFEEEPPFGQGYAAATGIGYVKWVQLWEDGPKFAEYNVGAAIPSEKGSTMTFIEAAKTGDDYIWGANWRTPSKKELNELLLAATNMWSEKVTCKYEQVNDVWGFTFTGKGDYAGNSVFFPTQGGNTSVGYGYYMTETTNDSEAWNLFLYYGNGEFRSECRSVAQTYDCLVRPVLYEEEPVETTGKAYATDPACYVNWVQLWEGGPKFAEYNVGATSATEYGGYYNWGMSSVQTITNAMQYFNGYKLYGEYDTATHLWGSKWRMPTSAEFAALINNENCTCTWTTRNGVKGLLCTGKEGTAFASNSVFLPAAGCYHNGKINGQSDIGSVIGDIGETPLTPDNSDYGCYWSSTSSVSSFAYCLGFDSNGQGVPDYACSYGCSVRAVLVEE